MNREGTWKESEKKIPKWKNLKVPVCQESRISQCAAIMKKSSAKKDPHVIIVTHKNGPTANRKVVAHGWINDYASDDKTQRSGNATLAIKLEHAQDLNCVLKGGQGSRFTVPSFMKNRLACRLRRTRAHAEQGGPYSWRARHDSQIERILFDYGDWVNDYDRRSCCLFQRFGHVKNRPLLGRLICRAPSWEIMRKTCMFMNVRKDNRPPWPQMANSSTASRPIVCQ